MLIDPRLRSSVVSYNIVLRYFMGVWRRCQNDLSHGQSLLASFIYHPKFQEPTSLANFEKWRQAGMGRLGKLGSPRGVISEAQVAAKLGQFLGQRYQYMQVRHFLNGLGKPIDVFRPLTLFEQFLERCPTKKLLSTVYQVLLSCDKVTD